MMPKVVITLAVTNTKTGEIRDVEFVVIKNNFTCLMGSTTVQQMGLLTVHRDKFVAEVKQSKMSEGTDKKTTIRDRNKTMLILPLIVKGNAPLRTLGLKAP